MATMGVASTSEASSSRKIGLSCAECRRSKLKCDRVFPCQSCIRRGCAGICPEGTLAATKGNKVLMAHAQKLTEQVKTLTSRVRELESTLHETSSNDQGSNHNPLPETTTAGDVPLREDANDVYEAIGSLSIGLDGQTKYHGESASSEYLQSLLSFPKEDFKTQESTPINLPTEILTLMHAFPFGFEENLYSKNIFNAFLPKKQRALQLAALYYRNYTWMYDPIVRVDFFTTIIDPMYANDRANAENLHSHRLSVFFMVLALGSVYDAEDSRDMSTKQYQALARATLSLDSILREVTCATVQALFLVSRSIMCNSDQDGKEGRWLMTGLCARIAQTIGLQRDSKAWNLEESEIQLRRRLYWELFTWESWTSLVNGRPAALMVQHSDCQFPEDLEPSLTKVSGEVELGFHAWKFRYAATCLSASVLHVFNTKPTPYSALLDIDKTIRKFPIPNHLRSPVRASEAGRSWSNDLSRAMQQYGALCVRESNLLYIHRSYFAQAIRQDSEDPLRHKYAPSVLATYRSACRLISSLRGLYPSCPSVQHVWFFWSGIFSSCVVLGALIIESPGCTLALDALHEFKLALPFYEEGSSSCRPASTLETLQKLYHRANSVYTAFRAGLEDYDTGIYNSNRPDELEVLGGRKSVINQKSNTNSPTNPVPGSPSTLYEDGSTPDSHTDRGDMMMGYYERSGSPVIANSRNQDYEMNGNPTQFDHQPFLPSLKPLLPHVHQEGRGVIPPSIDHYRGNRHPAPVAPNSLSTTSSLSYHSTGKPSEVWQAPYPPPHDNQGRTSNPSGLSLPYTNPPQFQAGTTAFGLPAGQEPNQDEIWRNFLLEFGG
ncbi:fungal-specific transcription factor domain-containing protein [Collybia nuda]|uniref:Fungal-specific transcription factor domain-containing protein n=1 Tax=Collybia nuda TaxID=64659 RepID=A0A9P5XVF9_9AGAR|nr:fungal-specific transcription factor domain-containing protein [Collybia nuda]